MRVDFFMQSTFYEEERDVLRCLYNGVKQDLIPSEDPLDLAMIKKINSSTGLGTGVNYSYEEKIKGKYNLGVIYGSWKPERGNLHHKVKASIVEKDIPFLCIETQLLGRKITDAHDYYRIGINGFLNEAAIFGIEQKYDRTRFDKLGLEYNGWKPVRGNKVIIALQLPGDASLRNMDINTWCIWVLDKLKDLTDRPIEIRTHPALSQKGIDAHLQIYQHLAFNKMDNVTFVDGRTISWQDQLKDAHCVITYTSGLAIDSILSGIPVIACDPGNFAWSISSNSIERVEDPLFTDVHKIEAWLNTLSYCQWSKEEMQSGEAWAHLKPAVQKYLNDKENEDESS